MTVNIFVQLLNQDYLGLCQAIANDKPLLVYAIFLHTNS
ncbi:hypothetical protein GXM_00787 [Nostoc sphaeroides CCNUC1]|uniref:Uncharacterized protein n=1 Tax=Nostoc sphaeroides CCNUC1 TaxID=2653204 RepID=A0A5P8VSL6_9NOSO|nr:hypothetical protein GXM_00787 [Nostoc sphaeroides CCNUC1]